MKIVKRYFPLIGRILISLTLISSCIFQVFGRQSIYGYIATKGLAFIPFFYIPLVLKQAYKNA